MNSFPILLQKIVLIFVLLVHPSDSQEIITAQLILSNPGTQYLPVNMQSQLISSTTTDTVKACIALCTNDVLCGVCDHDVSVSKQCRLFEGDADTLGQILPPPSPQSQVGAVRLSAILFAEYGSPCTSFCFYSRYLQCGTNCTCECMPYHYWDTSTSMCLRFHQCGRKQTECFSLLCSDTFFLVASSVLEGQTIINRNTTIGDNSTAAFNGPFGIHVFKTNPDAIVVTELYNNRTVVMWNIGTANQTVSVLATQWASGQSLVYPYDAYVDVNNSSNLYVSDTYNHQVVLYSNMQSVNPPPGIVAGTAHNPGPAPMYLMVPYGIQVDSSGNLYVASEYDHRVMFWPPNATQGTVAAGLGIPSNSSMGLYKPNGVALDEKNQWLYVADGSNNRIQRFSLNDSWPCNGTTVAGGNGAGTGSHQLNWPTFVRISKKTGAIYIVDGHNNRVQRWQPGAREGVTIAGDPAGSAGSSASTFWGPVGLSINADETQMYVTDLGNTRVQRFQLI